MTWEDVRAFLALATFLAMCAAWLIFGAAMEMPQ